MKQYVLRIVKFYSQSLDWQTSFIKENLMEYVPFELERWVRFQKTEMEEAYSKKNLEHEKGYAIREGQGTFEEE